jgi:8-hydroxy-5-deazaflavin:NADPH oxidoreductase
MSDAAQPIPATAASATVAILGCGRVGRTLATAWHQAGVPVVVGSRDPEAARERVGAEPLAWRVVDYAEAIRSAPICVLAVPWSSVREILESHGPWTDKLLIDCINPLNATFDGLATTDSSSAAEQIAAWAPGSHVVQTLNTASAELMANPLLDGHRPVMLLCGDSSEAKQTVGELLKKLGFEPADCGALAMARFLEPTAMLYIQMAVRQGYGSRWGMKLIRESADVRPPVE